MKALAASMAQNQILAVRDDVCRSVIFVVPKSILVLVFIPFDLHNFSYSFYYISDIPLVLVVIRFFENNFSFYLVPALV